MLDITAVGPRQYFRQTNTFDRLLDPSVDADRELLARVKNQGVREPIIVFAADKFNELWLIDGHRRLQAAKAAGMEQIPAIVVRTYDDLLDVLFAQDNEYANGNDDRVPMKPSEKLQYALIIQGVQAFMRAYYRQSDGSAQGCSKSFPDVLPVVGLTLHEWNRIRFFACLYTKRPGANLEMAASLLADVDKGELGIGAAANRYTKHTTPSTVAEVPSLSPKAWKDRVRGVTASLEMIASHLRDLENVPNAITPNEVRDAQEGVATYRRRIALFERYLGYSFNRKEVANNE